MILAPKGTIARILSKSRGPKGYWTSAGGKSQEAMLPAANGAEINKKGDASRFARPEPGKFTLRS
jgi:hypothetical protein